MIGEALLELLRAEQHYAVDWVRDGAMADTALRSHNYDLVLLDLGLPKRDGLEVLRALRQRRDRVPVLVATARDAVADRVAGLDAGADDYVLKPYDMSELLARIRTVLRRAPRPLDVPPHARLAIAAALRALGALLAAHVVEDPIEQLFHLGRERRRIVIDRLEAADLFRDRRHRHRGAGARPRRRGHGSAARRSHEGVGRPGVLRGRGRRD